MSLRVRPATPADLPAILAIYNEAVANTTATADYEPATLEARTQWYHERVDNGYPVFVAVVDVENAGADNSENNAKPPQADGASSTVAAGEIVAGWSSLSRHNPRPGYNATAEVSVYVDAAYRRQGVGKVLLPPLIEAATTRGLHVLMAGIDSENQGSLRLHESFGFERAGRFNQIVYKFGKWLDVIYLQRFLP